MTHTIPSAEYLHECFALNEATGELTWRQRPSRHFGSIKAHKIHTRLYAGKLAGSKDMHYVKVHLDGFSYVAHRLVWRMIGNDPDQIALDHKDGDGYNNAPGNLRAATSNENARNCPGKGGVTMLRGVYPDRHPGDYRARIRVNGRLIHLGIFPSKGLAAVAHAKAQLRYHGEFACFRQKRAA